MNTMRSRHLPALLIGIAFAAAALAATPATAAQAGGPPSGDRPCRDDAMKYCADHVGDRDAMRACMREHQASFSQQCRDAMQARMQAHMQGQGQGKGPGPQGQQGQSGAGGASDDDS
jgi:hypothetical protein